MGTQGWINGNDLFNKIKWLWVILEGFAISTSAKNKNMLIVCAFLKRKLLTISSNNDNVRFSSLNCLNRKERLFYRSPFSVGETMEYILIAALIISFSIFSFFLGASNEKKNQYKALRDSVERANKARVAIYDSHYPTPEDDQFNRDLQE